MNLRACAYDGVVYFGASDGQVYAVDVETKSVKPGWPFQAEDAVWGSPLVADGRVYVAAMDHHVYCLDAETGKLIWKQQVGGAMAAQPTLDPERGLLYVGAFDGKAYAIQADSGELVDGFEFKAGNWIWSEVLLTGDRVYVASLDGRLTAHFEHSVAVTSEGPRVLTSLPLGLDSGLPGDYNNYFAGRPMAREVESGSERP